MTTDEPRTRRRTGRVVLAGVLCLAIVSALLVAITIHRTPSGTLSTNVGSVIVERGVVDGVLRDHSFLLRFPSTGDADSAARSITLQRLWSRDGGPYEAVGRLIVPTASSVEGNSVVVEVPSMPIGMYSLQFDGGAQVNFATSDEVQTMDHFTDVRQCIAKENIGNCVSLLYSNLLIDTRDSEAVLRRVDADVKAHPDLGALCHGYAHMLGGVWGTTMGKSESLSMPADFETCNKGYLHGMFESQAYLSTVSELTKALPTLCPKFSKWMNDCAHDEGHLAYLRAGGDMDVAISICGGLTVSRDLEVCASGATMSWTADHVLPPDASQEEINATFDICNSYDVAEVRYGCFEHIPLVMSSERSLIEKVMDACRATVKGADEQYRCWYGVGRFIGISEFNDGGKNDVIDEALCTKAPTVVDAGGCTSQLSEFRYDNFGNLQSIDQTCRRVDVTMRKTMRICTERVSKPIV